ncbi:MAG TPA: hypothetical protein VL996_14475 [Methylocella sp.]|nr:hypothetical protein [Methylocella sp.]
MGVLAELSSKRPQWRKGILLPGRQRSLTGWLLDTRSKTAAAADAAKKINRRLATFRSMT